MDAPVCSDLGRGLDDLIQRKRILSDMVRSRPRGDVHLWRFQLVDRADTSTLVPILLRHILATYLQTPAAALLVERTTYGKPFIAASTPNPHDLRFNMSHSGGSIAVVLAEGRDCGVDIEERPDDVDVDLMVRFCGTPQEVEAFSRLDLGSCVQDHFLRFWTLKEAITKAIGVGLSYPLRQLDLYRPSLFNAPIVSPVLSVAGRRFICRSEVADSEALAVAVIADEPMRTVAAPTIYIDPLERSTTTKGDEHVS
jgi:phosphopantetheinyl transferase